MHKRLMAVILCVFILSCPVTCHAGNRKINYLEKSISEDEKQLENIKNEILNLEEEIDKKTRGLSNLNDKIEETENTRKKKHEEIKLRIQYLYENGDTSMMSALVSDDTYSAVLNKKDLFFDIHLYDRMKLDEYENIINDLKESQNNLEKCIIEIEEMSEKQDKLKNEMRQKIKDCKKELKKEIKKEEERKRREKERKEKLEKEKMERETRKASSEAATEPDGNLYGIKLKYSAPYYVSSNPLTRSKGVVYYGGHKETYYSQKVLAGGGLNIPGRHVADDGTVRDKDGYICVAANPSYRSKGTRIMTSLGPAKVYDCGCDHGTIDIYVNW